MIHLYTGDGKGKTTAATGLAVRAAGRGMKVYFAQFMKGGDSGELHVLSKLPQVRILRSRKEFGFYNTLSDKEKRELTEIHNGILEDLIAAAERESCDMIVLDEVTYPMNWGLLDRTKLERLLALGKTGEKSEAGREIRVPELVLTGREPEAFLLECADYVTEMKCVRHPYDKGAAAREGIEY